MGCCGSTQNKYCLAVPILPAGKACEKHVPCGNPPEKPNVTFRFKLKAPKHVVFNYITKRKDPEDADNMKVPGLVVIEEGEPGSPWGAMMNDMYGEAVPHFDVFQWSPEYPYMWSWRCTKAKKPIMKGVTGSFSITDAEAEEPNSCYVLFKAHMHLTVPVCLVKLLLSKMFPKVMRQVEKEYLEKGDAMYDGPMPPPAATPEQQPGYYPIHAVKAKQVAPEKYAPTESPTEADSQDSVSE